MHMYSLLFKMAVLIQYLVHCVSAKKCLANWAVNSPAIMLLEFYKEQVTAVTMVSNRCLKSMFVGKSKGDCTSEVIQNFFL